ncbi:beta-hexosaminidase subunit beta-like [Anticarsia gemmatalis]|uniref:beta-hexosaminidase subunit beta-like n=1 Tax=Anticarsia gemmatalis TaxID=129554 RepID=UPI003F763FE7
MLRHLIFFNAICVIFVASMTFVVNPGPKYPPTKGEVWPRPHQQEKHTKYFNLVPSVFKFTETGKSCKILKTAIERYSDVLRTTQNIAWRHSRRIWKHDHGRPNITDVRFLGHIEELQINLSEPCEEYPHFDMEERYMLNVSTVSTLNSDSIWGILRGMETFVQLFYMSDDYRHIFINQTEIEDYPRYRHRGLLIDTSRHYITVSNILKTLDAMEMNKMNVLHWHIVDDQSFPYQSDKFPHLSEQGAYDPTMIYTKANIEQIVNYAKDRGIRVLPEFDVPGHTRSWGVAYPNILTKCYQYGTMIGLGPMDPTNNMTYKLIGELFKEVQGIFPDKYFHVGGDEVEFNCWNSNTDIVNFMTRHNMTNPAELHAYFMNLVIPLLGEGSKPIVWQEVFDEGVPLSKDAIVQVWKGNEVQEMIQILSAGRKLIFSSAWYLDHLNSGGDWVDYYKADPRQMIPKSLSHFNLHDIVGGEACMWGEVVDDRNIISRVWPRTSAVAEKLWSAATPRYSYLYPYPPEHVFHRIEEHTCRMNRRGVTAQPPNGPGFCVA